MSICSTFEDATYSAKNGRPLQRRLGSWPPAPGAIEWLRVHFGALDLHPLSADVNGYVQFQEVGRLIYKSVTYMQRRVSAAMESFGGVCESWGVMHHPD